MARRAAGKKLKEACLLVALLVSMGVGAVVGLFEDVYKKEGESMDDRITSWFFAVLIVLIVVMQRMVDQVAGIHVLTSYHILIIPGVGLDMGTVPRGIYVPLEMSAALLSVCIVEFCLRRIKPDLPLIGLFGGMFIATSMLGVLHQIPIYSIGMTGALAFGARTVWKSESIAIVLIRCVQGIIAGCLLGGSLRYGFTMGIIIAISAWIARGIGFALAGCALRGGRI